MADFKPGDPDLNSPRTSNGSAASGSAPSNGHGPGPYSPGASGGNHGLDSGVDGLIHILRRQWHVIVLTVIAALLVTVLALMVIKPTYTAASTLKVSPMDLSKFNNTSNSVQVTDDFYDTECEIIKSTAVISLAMPDIRDTRTLRSVDHPTEYVQLHMTVEPTKGGKLIEVSFDSRYPEDAQLIVTKVVEAYKSYEVEAFRTQASDYLNTIREGSKGEADELAKDEISMQELTDKYGITDADPDKNPQHQEVIHLREQLRLADDNVREANTAYQEAERAIIGNPELLKRVGEKENQPRYSTDPQADLKVYQAELSHERAILDDDSRNYLPNHPTIIRDQARVNETIVFTILAAKDWQATTRSVQQATAAALEDSKKRESEIAEKQREYIELKADADRLRTMKGAVDEQAHQVKQAESNGAIAILVPTPSHVLTSPSGAPEVKPAKSKSLMIGMVLGVILGVALACVRDWTDDRMRTPQAIRSTVGAPILGAIPAITTAYTAADRGQIVHFEPFGDAAESYRTIRTALQFGMPPGSKTLLITSPVSGDGKSTFVSNLAIAMAQGSKRILIIDADFRAPMQHRLFGLKDRVGFASVLSGTDTIDQAIQHTEIENLDVLPCGPTPPNPAEMLNTPEFADHLNELADKYDLVLLDSPPVTAVADARILAASTDCCMLVVRLEASTRKQTEAARDGLRSVGAKLLGVAVNGVTRAGHFGGASGYYQAGSPMTARSSKRSSFSDTEGVSDPANRS